MNTIVTQNSSKNSEGELSDLISPLLQDEQMITSFNLNFQERKVIQLNFTSGNFAIMFKSLLSFQDTWERIKENKNKGEKIIEILTIMYHSNEFGCKSDIDDPAKK